MAAEITNNDESRVVAADGRSMWHRLGNVVDENMTAVQAGETYGHFTHEVDKFNLLAYSPQSPSLAQLVEQRKGGTLSAEQFEAEADKLASSEINISEDSRTPMRRVATVQQQPDGSHVYHGLVAPDYATFQNRLLAEFCDICTDLAGGSIRIATAGTIRDGQKIWYCADGQSFSVPGASKDQILPYMLFSNGHDGKEAIRITPTTIRVVCSNTLHMVLGNLKQATISIRHSSKTSERIEEAKTAMRQFGDALKRNEDLYGKLQDSAKLDPRKFFFDAFASVAPLQVPDHELIALVQSRTDSEGNPVTVTPELIDEASKQMKRVAKLDSAYDAFIKRIETEKTKLGLKKDSDWLVFNSFSNWLQHKSLNRGKVTEKKLAKQAQSALLGGQGSTAEGTLTALRIACEQASIAA